MIGLLHVRQRKTVQLAGQHHDIGPGQQRTGHVEHLPAKRCRRALPGRMLPDPPHLHTQPDRHLRPLPYLLPPACRRHRRTTGEPDAGLRRLPGHIGWQLILHRTGSLAGRAGPARCHHHRGGCHRMGSSQPDLRHRGRHVGHAACGPRGSHRLQPPADLESWRQIGCRPGPQPGMLLQRRYQQPAAQIEIRRECRMLGNQRQPGHRTAQPVACLQHRHLPASAGKRLGQRTARQPTANHHHMLHLNLRCPGTGSIHHTRYLHQYPIRASLSWFTLSPRKTVPPGQAPLQGRPRRRSAPPAGPGNPAKALEASAKVLRHFDGVSPGAHSHSRTFQEPILPWIVPTSRLSITRWSSTNSP